LAAAGAAAAASQLASVLLPLLSFTAAGLLYLSSSEDNRKAKAAQS